MTTKSLTKPTTAEFRQDEVTVVAKFNLRNRGVTFVNIPIGDEQLWQRIADMTPSDDDFEMASNPPPDSWYREQW